MSETPEGIKSVAIDPTDVPETNYTAYPEPYKASNQLRWNRRIGRQFGLTHFGVNITRIVAGGQSSSRHWHSHQDEFIYVLSGKVVLETNSGERTLTPGMYAGFAAGVEDGHRFVNRGDNDVLLLVVGDNTAGDEVNYPDIDLHGRLGSDGKYRFSRKDGTPLE
ncbi:MAG: cupin domain-containing protein [Roseiarcus sp.]